MPDSAGSNNVTLKSPKKKGNAFELWCAKRIVRYLGGECHRTIMSGATDWMKGDLVAIRNLLADWFFECKDRQTWAMPAWIETVREQAGRHPWVIVFKRNRFQPCVTLDFDEWLNGLAEKQELQKRVDDLEEQLADLEEEGDGNE
jgi:hypothetical protein